MNVLLIYPNRHSPTGNYATVSRISKHLIHAGNHVCCCDLDSALLFQTIQKYQFVVTIHALRSQPLLTALNNDCKLITIFGGTDLNINSLIKDDMRKMAEVVQRSVNCIAFSQEMLEKACKLWPDYEERFQVIPQGIKTSPSGLHWRLCLADQGVKTKHIVLLVAGIREVKDPTHVFNAFSDWSSLEGVDCSLVIVGPILSPEYGARFKSTVSSHRNIHYIGQMSLEDTHAAIAQSDVLINTSKSEGMAAVILEALQLGTAVVARNNAGNCSVIDHNRNGMIYEKPEDCVRMINQLLNDEDLKNRLIAQGELDISNNFSYDTERNLYTKLLSTGVDINRNKQPG